MKLKKEHEPSWFRTFAPYRGVMLRSFFTNSFSTLLHDLFYILRKGGKSGHEKTIKENFELLYEGKKESTWVSPLGKMCVISERIEEKEDLLSSVWTSYGNTTKTKGVTGVVLEDNGLLDPAGISSLFEGKPGEILVVSFTVYAHKEALDFSIGSPLFQNEDNVFQSYSLKAGEKKRVEMRFVVKSEESFFIHIDLHRQPDSLKATKVEISNLLIGKRIESGYGVTGIEEGIKPILNVLEQEAYFKKGGK